MSNRNVDTAIADLTRYFMERVDGRPGSELLPEMLKPFFEDALYSRIDYGLSVLSAQREVQTMIDEAMGTMFGR